MNEWRKKNNVSSEIEDYCTAGVFHDRRGLMDHLCGRKGQKNTCHCYAKDYMEELMK
jgi:hypothetical protein